MASAKGSTSSYDGEIGVSKKPRTVFSPKQLLYLEEEFLKNQFPNMEQRKKIAKTLDLTQQHIQVCLWLCVFVFWHAYVPVCLFVCSHNECV